MNAKTSHSVVTVLGIAVTAAFFLPFLDIGGLITASGWDIVTSGDVPTGTRLLFAALPVGGVAMLWAGLTRSPKARLVAFAFGASLLGYIAYQMVKFFFTTTGIGLWITIAAAVAAVVVALASRKR